MADENENEKVVFEKSTAQLDAERRVAAAEESNPEKPPVVDHFMSVQPTYGVETDEGYLGTDPIYQNAADERQEPMPTDEDWQRQIDTGVDLSDAGKENLPYVPEHLGTGAPKLAEWGPVTSTSTAVQPVDEPVQTSTTTASPAPTSRVATPVEK